MNRDDATDDGWQLRIVERYPHLFEKSGYPTVGRGWQDVIERALQRLATVVAFEPAGSWLRITQIKEKFGTLRISYWNSLDFSAPGLDTVEEVVDLAEARSACTCDECGARGRLHGRGGWVATRCEDHAEGEPIPIRPGWEGLHVTISFEAGKRVVTCRRYDRDIDVFDAALLPSDFDNGD